MYIRTEFTNHAQVICASQVWYPWGQENHKRRMTYACAHKVHHAQVAFASSLSIATAIWKSSALSSLCSFLSAFRFEARSRTSSISTGTFMFR